MQKVLLFVLMAGSVTLAQAQIKYGVKGGVNVSNAGGKDVEGNKATIGFHAGVFAEVPVTNEISVQPELVYSAQGAKYKEAGESTSTVNMNYINLPVLAKYRAPAGFFGVTGPQAGFLVSATSKEGGAKQDVKDQFRKVDLSWVFGAGYASGNVAADIRFNLGLSKLDKDGEFKAYNRVVQVGVYYTLSGKVFN